MRYQHDVLRLPCLDQITPIAAPGVVHGSFMPYPMTVTGVRASLLAGPTSGTMLVDIREEGSSILADPIELTAGSTSSTGMSMLPFIVDDVLGDAARIEVVIVDEASGDAVGLTVDIIGHRWVIPFHGPYGLSGPSGEGVGLPILPLEPPPVPNPTVTINQASGQADPALGTPVEFDVVFSEAVTGFTDADVTIGGTAGGTLTASVAGSGTTYLVTVNGMTTDGTVTASIAASVCTAVSSGLPNDASTSADNSVTWTRVYLDDFNRADDTNIGSDWRTPNDLGISSNQLSPRTGATNIHGVWDHSLGTADHYVEYDWIASTSTSSSSYLGLVARIPSPFAETYYMGRFYFSTGKWEIYRRVSGTFTLLADSATAPLTTLPARLRFEAETVGGDVVLRLYEIVAGVKTLRLTYTDSSGSKITTGNYIGIRVTNTATDIDNFDGGAL